MRQADSGSAQLFILLVERLGREQLTRIVDGHYIPLYTGLHGFGVNEKLLKEKSLPVPETWKGYVILASIFAYSTATWGKPPA